MNADEITKTVLSVIADVGLVAAALISLYWSLHAKWLADQNAARLNGQSAKIDTLQLAAAPVIPVPAVAGPVQATLPPAAPNDAPAPAEAPTWTPVANAAATDANVVPG